MSSVSFRSWASTARRRSSSRARRQRGARLVGRGLSSRSDGASAPAQDQGKRGERAAHATGRLPPSAASRPARARRGVRSVDATRRHRYRSAMQRRLRRPTAVVEEATLDCRFVSFVLMSCRIGPEGHASVLATAASRPARPARRASREACAHAAEGERRSEIGM